MRLNQYFGTGVGAGSMVVGKGLEEFEASQLPESADGVPETPEEALASLQDADEAQAHYVGEVDKLQEAEAALEQYLDVIRKANSSGFGLSPDAVSMLSIGLEHWERKFPMPELGLEDFPITASSAQGADNAEKGLGARLRKLWDMIKKAWAAIKDAAVAYYRKIVAGVNNASKRAEELLGKVNGTPNKADPASFDVKAPQFLFVGATFVGQDLGVLPDIAKWAFVDYPKAVEDYYTAFATLVRRLRPEDDLEHFQAELGKLKAPAGAPTESSGDDLVIKLRKGVPGNLQFVLNKAPLKLWIKPNTQRMGAPDSVTVKPESIQKIKARVEEVVKCLAAGVQSDPAMKGVSTALTSLTTTVDAYGKKEFDADVVPKAVMRAAQDVQGLGSTDHNKLMAYTVKVAMANLMLLEHELAAHAA